MQRIFTAVKLIFFLILSLIFLASSVSANINPPNFPSCVNPQGNQMASHATGTHGVPGVVTLYKGADTVYKVTEEAVVQCLCPENGDGVQTNWWKIPQLSGDEIENYKTQGWVFVPDGSVWGLDPAAYLAKNSNFSCRTGTSSSSSSNSSVGGVTSIGDILALASTGNIKTVYFLLSLGFISLTVGHLLSKKAN